MLKNSVLAVAISFVTPIAALAQDYSGALTLGYSHTDLPDFDTRINGLTLDGRLDFALGNGLSFGTRFNTIRLDVAGEDVIVSGSVLGIDVGYAVSDAFSAGVFYEHAELGGEFMGTSLSSVASSNAYGVEASYKTGALEFGAFVGTEDIGGLVGVILAAADVDVLNYGISATYAPSDALTVGGSFIRTNLDPAGGSGIDIDYLGLAAVYDVNDTFSVFGGLSQTKLDLGDIKATTVSLGAGYDLSAVAGMPLLASIELAQTKPKFMGADTSINSLRLGVTIPLGGKGASAPLNSGADAILNPTHSAISQTVLNF